MSNRHDELPATISDHVGLALREVEAWCETAGDDVQIRHGVARALQLMPPGRTRRLTILIEPSPALSELVAAIRLGDTHTIEHWLERQSPHHSDAAPAGPGGA